MKKIIDLNSESYIRLLQILDEEFNKYIRQTRACYRCGKKDGMMFIRRLIPEVYISTRYDERNVFSVCNACNGFGHGAFEAAKTHTTDDILEDLESKSKEDKKPTIVDLIGLISKYKNLNANYELKFSKKEKSIGQTNKNRGNQFTR